MAGFFIDWLSGAPVADTQSGFRVYPASLLAAVRPRRGGFVLETEMLLRAADRGVSVREVPITPIHFEDRRSRFRPARDGLAVGTYLAGRIVGRWAREALAGAAWVVGIFSAARLRARHREMYQFAAPHRSHPPGWALAVGAFVADRALRTVERGLGSDHARGLRMAAVATAATPLLLVLALGRSALAALGVDRLGPVVRTLYSQDALAATLESPARRAAGPRSPGRLRRAGGRAAGRGDPARRPSSRAAGCGWPSPSARPSRAFTWGNRSCPPTCRCWSGWACSTR